MIMLYDINGDARSDGLSRAMDELLIVLDLQMGWSILTT